MNEPTVEERLAHAQEQQVIARVRSAQQLQAIKHVREAVANRKRDAAAKPTGVRVLGRTGKAQDIYDDGSIRNLYTRNPALSGRQFRKARKRVQRAALKAKAQ